MPDGGYSYDPNGLTQVTGHLTTARDDLTRVADQEIIAPDAGASSDVVAQAISDLIGAAVGAASVAEETGANVNIANGAYGAFENNDAGATFREQQQVMGDTSAATGPL
jgi:sugar (pentulose or hexulose) kinase